MFDAIARPFGMLLMFLYNMVNNYALALLLVAVVVKVILLPFQMKAKRGQLKQARLQPKLAEIQKKHAANKAKLNEEMQKLYKEEGVNPASGCLWSFIQMPIMIALFFAIRQPLTLMMGVGQELLEEGGTIYEKLLSTGFNFEDVSNVGYMQIEQAQFITQHFELFAPLSEHLQRITFNLGNINLAMIPEWQFWNFPWDNAAALLPLLILLMFPLVSGGAQFLSMAVMRKMNVAGTPETAAGAAGNIIKFMPLMSVFFGFMFPAALSFYWTIGTVLQLGQDIWLTKKYTKILDEEDAEKEKIRAAKEAEIEAKRLETERKKAEGLAERNSNTSKRKKKKGDKQGKREKAAEWEKKNAPVQEDSDEEYEPSRVGKRRYARGRAYNPDRFSKGSGEKAISGEIDETLDLTDEEIEVDGIAVEKQEAVEDYVDTESEFADDSSEDFEEEDVDEDNDNDEDDNEDDSNSDEGNEDNDSENTDEDDEGNEPEDIDEEKFDTKRFD